MKLCVRTMGVALTVAVMAVVGSASTAGAQQGSIAFVNTDRFQEIASLRAAQQVLQDSLVQVRSRMEVALAPMQQQFETMVQEFQQQQGVMPPDRREARERALMAQQARIQEAAMPFEQRVQELRNQIMGPTGERINRALDAVRQERGYAAIMDLAAGNVLSHDRNLDITDEVLRRINSQAAPGR
jgi:Skp family chaperone for outer membrane proteins